MILGVRVEKRANVFLVRHPRSTDLNRIKMPNVNIIIGMYKQHIQTVREVNSNIKLRESGTTTQDPK